MLYPDIDAKIWTKRYNLNTKALQCQNCKEYFSPTIPILIKGYAGIETPVHNCGKEFVSATFMPTTQDEISYWSSLYA